MLTYIILQVKGKEYQLPEPTNRFEWGRNPNFGDEI